MSETAEAFGRQRASSTPTDDQRARREKCCRELRRHGRMYEADRITGEAWARGVNAILRTFGYR